MAFGSIVPSLSAFLIIISATVALAQQPGRVVARLKLKVGQSLSAAEVIADVTITFKN